MWGKRNRVWSRAFRSGKGLESDLIAMRQGYTQLLYSVRASFGNGSAHERFRVASEGAFYFNICRISLDFHAFPHHFPGRAA